MRLRQQAWVLNKKSREFVRSDELKKNANTFKGSVLAIVCGFVVAGIVIACLNVNPFVYFAKMFNIAFDPLWVNQTFQWASIYIVAGLSVGVGFAAGLFNIGVAGQMLSGAALSTVVVNLIKPNNPQSEQLSGGLVFLVFIICVGTATLMAIIAGWLKTRFNIHEVVSTIMLNWIVWYTVKFIFLKWQTKFATDGVSSNPFPGGQLDWGTSQIAVPLIVALVCVVIVWMLLRKTVFGFKVKAVGYSETVAKYAGVNVTQKVLATMAISGALAGVASFLNIFTISPNIFIGVDNLPTVGYDAIAVTLVAFNNAWGIVIVSLLWAVAQSAGTGTASLFSIPIQMSTLVFGLIVYFAAISIIFIRWNPVKSIRAWWFIHHNPTHREHLNRLHGELVNYRWWNRSPKSSSAYSEAFRKYQASMQNAKNDAEKAELTSTWTDYKRDFKERNGLMAGRMENEIRNYKTQVYNEMMESGLIGLKRRARNRLQLVDQNGLELVANTKLNYVKNKNNFIKFNERFTKHYQTEMHAENERYAREKKALKVWKEGQIGIVKGEFDYRNEKITLHGQLQKDLAIIREDRKNANSELRLEKHLIRFDRTLSNAEKQAQIDKAVRTRDQALENLRKAKVAAHAQYKIGLERAQQNHQKVIDKLNNDSTPIHAIDQEYQSRFEALEAEHQKNKASIYKRNDERRVKIDVEKARANYLEGKMMAEKACEKITYFNNEPKSTKAKINKLNEEIKMLNETLSQISKLYGGSRFKEFDDNHFVNAKTSVLLRLLKTIFELNVEKDIVMNNEFDCKTRQLNNDLNRDVKRYLNKNPELVEQGWRKIRLKMHYSPDEVKADQQATTEINQMINKLETKHSEERK